MKLFFISDGAVMSLFIAFENCKLMTVPLEYFSFSDSSVLFSDGQG